MTTSRETLKKYFGKAKKPTADHFAELIESSYHVADEEWRRSLSVVGGDLSVGTKTNKQSLTVSGTTALEGGLAVTGDTTVVKLTATGATTLNGGLSVTGATNVAALSVSGNANLKGDLEVKGATNVASLTASGAATLNGDLSVKGKIHGPRSIFMAGLWETDYARHARITLNHEAFGIGAGSFGGDNQDCLYFFAPNQTNRDIRFMHQSSVTSNPSDTTKWTTDLIVKAGGNVGIGTTVPSEKLEVAGNIKVTGATNVAALTASGAATLNGGLSVTGATNVATLTASGATTLNGILSVTGATTLQHGLTVEKKTDQKNAAELKGPLHMLGNPIYWRKDAPDVTDDFIRHDIVDDIIEIGGFNGVALGYTQDASKKNDIRGLNVGLKIDSKGMTTLHGGLTVKSGRPVQGIPITVFRTIELKKDMNGWKSLANDHWYWEWTETFPQGVMSAHAAFAGLCLDWSQTPPGVYLSLRLMQYFTVEAVVQPSDNTKVTMKVNLGVASGSGLTELTSARILLIVTLANAV